MWYWHSPFQVAPDDLARLKRMGVEELYVRAGTLSTDGEQVVLTLRQEFKKGPSLPIHLVINADAGILHRFGDLSMADLAKTISTDFVLANDAATKQGLEVRGLQLDIDVPTRLLPRYAELLSDLKPMLPKGQKLSITSLTTWFSSNDFAKVVQPLDFYAPQFYEASVPSTIDADKPITNLAELKNGLDAAAQLGVPFMIGAPSYGQALLFDDKGSLAGTYRGLSPEDACRHPSLRFVSWNSEDGEERLTLRAIKAGANGKGLGYRIVYRRPTPQAIAEFYRQALANRPSNCLGIALFRFPEPGEELATPLPTLEQALAGQLPKPTLRVKPEVKQRVFAAIESPHGAIEHELTFAIESAGDGETCLGPSAMSLELKFPQGAVEEVQPGGFDGATPFLDDPTTAGTASLAHSNGVMLWRAFVGPGDKLRGGPILLKGAGRLTVRWTLTDPSGAKTEGELNPIQFGGK